MTLCIILCILLDILDYQRGENLVMDFIIREATEDDVEQVAYVHYTAWIETYTGFIDAQFLKTRSLERSLQFFKETECKNIVVACKEDQIVGFCGYGKARDKESIDGEIQGIYVLKECQHQGIGLQLIEYAKKKLSFMGFQKAYLWVLNNNKNAICFYEKIGFIFEGGEKKEWLGEEVIEKRYSILL